MTQATVAPPASSGTVRVVPVSGRADLKRFIEYPYQKYRNHPVWVPPLLVQEWDTFNRDKNPAFDDADVDLFLALSGDNVVGRIAALENRRFNQAINERSALFGYFEAENPEIARALLETVEDWGRKRGVHLVRGPFPVSLNDLEGLLIENFDDPPTILMAYNPPEYKDFIEAAGYTKSMDTFAWRMYSKDGLPERVARIAKRVKQNLNVVVRELDWKKLDQEVPLVLNIYNRAWADNWGFIPVTPREAMQIKDSLKTVADRKTTLIAEVNGQAAGFTIMLPDINQLLRGTGGRLFPLGLPKLLLGKPKRSRLYALGVLPEFRGKGLDALLYAESFWRGIARYNEGEFGITLESNEAINTGMKALGAEPYKRYRIFEKKLED
jgi:GNAT superfamily N-acetyltransferase